MWIVFATLLWLVFLHWRSAVTSACNKFCNNGQLNFLVVLFGHCVHLMALGAASGGVCG